jgi:nucleoside-diphosphate-sugar epimerase
MAAEAGVSEPAVMAPERPGELLRNCLDPGRAGIHLGWRPWTTLPEGCDAVLKWFRGRDS